MTPVDEGLDPPENWKPIKGYEGLYDVSDLGRIRSHDRDVLRRNGRIVRWNGRILKPNRGSKGHYRVNLFREGQPRMVYIHQVVAKEFLPNPNNLPLVRHLDDVKENNALNNLAWGTHSDNRQDAIRNGTQFGIRNLTKTECKWGHPFDESNTYWDSRGHRACRRCKLDSFHRNKHKKEKTHD